MINRHYALQRSVRAISHLGASIVNNFCGFLFGDATNVDNFESAKDKN